MNTTLKLSNWLASCALVWACFTSASSAQDRDRVYPAKGGAMTTGKIVERTPEKIVIEPSRGGPVEFPIFEVGRVVFDGEPAPLSNAKLSALQGNWAQAESEISQVNAAALKNDAMREELQFFKAYIAGNQALHGKGNPTNAAKLLVDWARANSTSHNYFAGMETLGNLAMVMGKPSDATRFYNFLATSKYPDLGLKGNYLLGKAMLAQGNVDDARSKFNLAMQATVAEPSSLRLQKLSRVALIRCDADGGDPDAAIQSLEKLVSEEDSSDAVLFAEIFNTLGNIYEKKNNTYEAVISFLKTDKLYSSQVEPHAEALYQLSQLWPKVGEPLRGNQAKAELVRLYPTSIWAKK